MKVSILLLTMERYYITKYALENNLNKIGDIEYELLILDQNSKDFRVIELGMNIVALKEKGVHESAQSNVGIAAGYNSLINRAKGEYICFMPNDVLLNDNWLFDLLHHANQIDKAGLVSIHCEGDKGFYTPLLNQSDTFTHVWKRKDNIVNGVSLIKRTTLDAVGKLDESLGIYGKEREQLAYRLNMLGYNNFYVPDQSSVHLGREVNDVSEYKQNKNKALQLSANTYTARIAEMKKNNNYVIRNMKHKFSNNTSDTVKCKFSLNLRGKAIIDPVDNIQFLLSYTDENRRVYSKAIRHSEEFVIDPLHNGTLTFDLPPNNNVIINEL